MDLYHSIDGLDLEKHLLDALSSRPLGGLTRPVLVLVPTHRLARHLTRRIAERLDVALGVHILTHRALAVRVLEFALEPSPRVLSPLSLEALVETIIDSQAIEDATYLKSHRGALSLLVASLRDLREAGVEPVDLDGIPALQCLRVIYPHYVEALTELEAQGWTDEAGLVKQALPHVKPFLERKNIVEVYHHGAFDLVGEHLELLREIESVMAVRFLLPAEAPGPAYDFAWKFVSRLESTLSRAKLPLIRRSIESASESRRSYRGRLSCLYDARSHHPDALDAPRLEIAHAQGGEAELRLAALRALSIHDTDDVPLNEIAIVARSLESYAPHLEDTFRSLGLPFTSSASAPLLRQPAFRALLTLLGLITQELPAEELIDLLRSGMLCVPEIDLSAQAIDQWDLWSREDRVLRGLTAWRHSAMKRPPDDPRAALLLELVGVLRAEAGELRARASLEAQRGFLLDLFERRIEHGEDSAENLATLGEALDTTLQILELRAESSTGGEAKVTPVKLVACLEKVLGSLRSSIAASDRGGVRVLDLMQARGTVHRVVIWIGFQHGVFPRRGHANPYLSDAAREALIQKTSATLSLKSDAPSEERALLASTLGAVGERLVLCFQRADDDGRKIARSSALREVARLFTGDASVASLLRDEEPNPFRPERFPTHPAEEAEMAASSPRLGLYPLEDTLLSEAARLGGAVAGARALLEDFSLKRDDWNATLDAVECLERFDLSDLRFDGFTGLPLPAEKLRSATRLEGLARCPLAFFHSVVLELEDLPERDRPHVLPANDIGDAIHATLAALYRELVENGLLEVTNSDRERLIDDALGRLERLWGVFFMRMVGARHDLLPAYFALVQERWRAELEVFVMRDLPEVLAFGAEKLELEAKIDGKIRLDEEHELSVTGRLDRVLIRDGSVEIHDYKTGRNPADWRSPKAILEGSRIQLPFYRELFSGSRKIDVGLIGATVLGVGTADGSAGERRPLDMSGDMRAGFLESLRVILELTEKGYFPAYPDSSSCSYCSFRRNCRKTLEPTRWRFDAHSELSDFRDVKKKRKKTPTLQILREAAEGDD